MPYLLISLDILNACAAVALAYGLAYLCLAITYPYDDTCALFAMADGMRGFNRYDIHYACIGPSEGLVDDFGQDCPVQSYDLFLNLVRFFPASLRFRLTQAANVAFYLAYAGVAFLLLRDAAASMGAGGDTAWRLALLGALLLALRTRMLFLAALAHSEIINYLLFVVCAWLVHAMGEAPTLAQALLLGGLAGLSYRNRPSEMLLIASGAGYLLLAGPFWGPLAAFFLAVGLVNADALYARLFLVNPDVHFLRFVLDHHCSGEGGGAGGMLQRIPALVVSGLRQMLDFSERSLWSSVGSHLLLLPVSVGMLAGSGLLGGFHLFLLLYLGLYLAAGLFIRRNQMGSNMGATYYGCKEMWFVLPPMALLNALGLAAAFADGTRLAPLYAAWAAASIGYQAFRLARHTRRPSIWEKNFYNYPKKMEPFRQVLADFIAQAPKPLVLMGHQPLWGEAQHFTWSRDARCVNILRPVSDQELAEYIRYFGVTHVAVTPMSYFRNNNEALTLGSPELGPSLAGLLEVRRLSPEVLLYTVQPESPERSADERAGAPRETSAQEPEGPCILAKEPA